MKKPTKKELIRALKETLKEYEAGTHRLTNNNCKLCILAEDNCENCIMGVWGTYGCTKRKNEAYDKEDYDDHPNLAEKKRKIIIFFKELINYFENEKKFDFFFLENNFDFRKQEMKNIDEQAFND